MNSRGGLGSKCANLVEVGAADKGALAGAGQDDEAQRRIVLELLYRLDDLDRQRAVDRVELGFVVDRDPRDIAAFGARLAGNQNSHSARLRLEINHCPRAY